MRECGRGEIVSNQVCEVCIHGKFSFGNMSEVCE